MAKGIIGDQKLTTAPTMGHRHTYRLGDTRTSFDAGHSHPISYNKIGRPKIEQADGHTHEAM